jgi:hypothetical protein
MGHLVDTWCGECHAHQLPLPGCCYACWHTC